MTTRRPGGPSPRSPYPAYKDSGVDWLGQVPEHWGIARLKDACRVNKETLSEQTLPDYLLLYVDIGNVDSTGAVAELQEMSFADAPSRARRVVQSGDTIISTVRTYLRAIRYFQDAPDNLIASTGFAVLSPGPMIDASFLALLVRSEPFIQRVVAESEGVGYPAIAPSKLAGFYVWIPPLPEQRAIAAYLDREAARIDALTAKQQRLIALLGAKRTALITRAVTRGLDEAAPLKDSGVAWLGQVPEHWEVTRLKRVARMAYGESLPEADRIDGAVPVFGSNGWVGTHSNSNTDSPTVIIGRKGSYGKVVYSESRAFVIDTAFYVDSTTTESDIRWLFYLLATLDLDESSEDSAVPGLSRESVYAKQVPLPPLPEQRAIAAYLDRETARIDALVAKVEQAIARLHEYRRALITAAVTGQIDVRAMTQEVSTP
jgi:type I restriction enzyme S subunit